ncbi:MAG TPA: TIGR02266 family protein [Sandaracinaceae bacterium]
MPTSEELRRAGVEAAREARAILAELVSLPDPALSEGVPNVVAALYAAEIGDAHKVLGALREATMRLRAVLDACEGNRRASTQLSRALALLHPVRTELERLLDPSAAREREDATQPFLLTSTRVKSASPPAGEAERRDEDDRRLELELEVGVEGNSAFFTGRTGDIGKGGVFVATDDPLPVGTEVLVSFVLPDGYRVRAEGEVAWVRVPRYRPDELPAGMGVRFVRLSPKDERAINHFLTQLPTFRYGD